MSFAIISSFQVAGETSRPSSREQERAGLRRVPKSSPGVPSSPQPSAATATEETTALKEECRLFVDKIAEFKKIVGNLIELVDQLAKATENEKIKAIGARNLLKSIAKQREAQQQQLQALIAEKKTQLERYRVEYQTLCKIEADQNEFIDQFIFQK
ncbi:PREDICTED: intraflagellar transport protein 20 homolog [Thamnophis sirtalis]|uniref:Intraflagellar transport protein 20 homolog n=1 Tax=Thamnophis sirtalis TaxID=35019 RepID=A0A6I9YVG0_9SAUR|nr:PREDICTED: intraflagellar transport protein 20 homolog [Thamnophis sirtalis]